MCPEYYYGVPPKKYGPAVSLCRVTEEPLSENQLNQMCRNNCTSCQMYRSRHTSTRLPSQGQNKSGSSSGGLGIIFVIAAVALVTKFLGIW